MLAVNLSRIAEEFILWSTTEFGFLELSDELSSTSSIMPQKKNPDALEIMRARCARAMGNLTSGLAIMKALPLAYNRDLQELSPLALDSFEVMENSASILAKILGTSSFNRERMRSACEDFLTATELADIARIKARVLFNILSENMTPKHWRRIAEEVVKELNGSAWGVVVAHGTDTMSYTGAALAFMLKNLTKPVVLVGSQRSSDRPSSDAALNLIAATRVATSDLAEVVVVMHATSSDEACAVHRATKVRKMHSSRRDAFKSINVPPIGEVREEVKLFGSYRRRSEGEVYADTRLEERVALFKAYPGVDPELLEYCVDRYRGIVLEGTGLGHVPEQLFPAIERARDEGKAVVMTTSTLYGRVDMKVYSTGRRLLNLGVIPGEDMLPEVAYVKLMHVLAVAQDEEEVRSLMLRNLAGEITPRTLPDTFY